MNPTITNPNRLRPNSHRDERRPRLTSPHAIESLYSMAVDPASGPRLISKPLVERCMNKATAFAASVKHNLSPATLHRRATIAAGGTAILGAVLTGYGLDLATQPQGDQSQLAQYDTDSIVGAGLGGMLLGGAAEALLLGAYVQGRRETELATIQPQVQTPSPAQLPRVAFEG